jgi:hypothetical protein
MTGEVGIVCSTCGADNRGPRTACERCGHALPPPAQIEPGFLIASRYEVRGMLGAGGMGVVYRAHDRLLDETVAIKVLRPDAAHAPDLAARFISEIKLARTVSHRNVARIHEYGEDGGIRYISMAFVDGVDLKRVLREQAPLPPGRAFDLGIQVAEGLHAIHEEGIVHRDLKTSNIMVDGHGVARLMDFGLAKAWASGVSQDMTASGQIVGTPEYMSPEQILGRELSRSSDIYSLAVVVYELFTGHTPFRGDTPIATLMSHLNDPPPLQGPPAERLPRALIPLIGRGLGKRPEERFGSALEFARALEQARDERPPAQARGDPVPTVTITLTPTAVPSTSVGRLPASGGRRLAFGLGAALAVAVVGGLLVFALRHRDAGNATAGHAGLAPSLTRSQASAVSVATPSPAPVPALGPTSPPQQAPGTWTAPPPHPRAEGRAPREEERGAGTVAPSTGVSHRAATPAEAPAGARPGNQVESMLADAGAALAAQRYDDAIALYDKILELDPHQQVALIGRVAAVNAKGAGRAVAVPAPAAGRSFVAGKTSVSPADAGPDGAFSQAFEEDRKLGVRNDVEVGRPPGRIEFETRPAVLRAGDRYTLHVYFSNPATAPIEIREMVVTNTVNGRKSSGPVASSTRIVAPEQRALLLSLSDFLAEDAETWSLEVRVRTVGGEVYRNQLTWK